MLREAGTQARRLLAVIALASAFGCATARPIEEQQPVVVDFELVGNEALSDDEILARIRTAETSWIPFSDKQRFDEAAFETDLERIVRLYQAEGFYQARIEERLVSQVGPNEVSILVRIDEGPPTRVADLIVEGLDELPEPAVQQVLAGLPLSVGEVFTEAAYDAHKVALLDRLKEVGYAEAEVNGLVDVELETDEATVVFGVDTGPLYAFGQVFVAGANRIPRTRIIDTAREVIGKGDVYRESALSEVQERLANLAVFSAVKVTRGAPDRQERTIPVVISVREAPFRTLRAGVGAGIDPIRNELPRVSFEWTNRNFFGGLRKLTFENEYALVFIPNLLQAWDDPSRRGIAGSSKLEFNQPDFFARDLTLTNALEYERGVEQSYRYNAAIASVGLIWRISRYVTLIPSYNLNIFQLSGTVALTRARTQEALLDVCAATGELCALSYFEQLVTWERRDNPVHPRRGYLLTLALQEGTGLLFGDYSYIRILPEARGYIPFGRHVFAVRLRTGLLYTAEGESSSVLTRFFLGGSNSQRGFGIRSLSPQLIVASGFPPWADAFPIGGNGMIEANAELRFDLPRDFGLVLFTDVGDVQPEVRDLSFGTLQVASGIGFRYFTAVGAIRVDFAWRLNALGFPPPLQPGEAAIPTVHFSIGEAF